MSARGAVRVLVALAVPVFLGVCVWYVFAAVWPGPRGLGERLWQHMSDREAFATTVPGLVFVAIVLAVTACATARIARLVWSWGAAERRTSAADGAASGPNEPGPQQ